MQIHPRHFQRIDVIYPKQEAKMFTIEHEFDATVITLVDEGVQELALREDITIEAFEDCVVMRQLDPLTEEEMVITLSLQQLSDLTAALNLPEGSYRIKT
jgi:hypothetical protein